MKEQNMIKSFICITFGLFMLLTPKKTYERAEEINRKFNIKARSGRRFSSVKSAVILCRISGILVVIVGILLLIVNV